MACPSRPRPKAHRQWGAEDLAPRLRLYQHTPKDRFLQCCLSRAPFRDLLGLASCPAKFTAYPCTAGYASRPCWPAIHSPIRAEGAGGASPDGAASHRRARAVRHRRRRRGCLSFLSGHAASVPAPPSLRVATCRVVCAIDPDQTIPV
eukprot:gene6213-biopygen5840